MLLWASSPSTPFPWKGDARRAGVGRSRKRAKPTSGATRHLLPEEGGRSEMSSPSTPFPWKGDARRAGGWPKSKESKANLRRAMRHLLPEKGGRSGMSNPSPLSLGRAGVGRSRKRAKPTSGATRHLLPEEGGRSGMSSPSIPFPWKGNARRARGWPKAKKSEANLRRYAPPTSRGRREKRDE